MASRIELRSVGLVLVFALIMCIQEFVGAMECQDLDEGSCAFAVSSSGNRCLLEKRVKNSGEEYTYICESSQIGTDIGIKDHIETDSCIESCGLTRRLLGISSDSLLEPRNTQRLCSVECYYSCPNIVDLYFSLAAGEGMFLPKHWVEEVEVDLEIQKLTARGYRLEEKKVLKAVRRAGKAAEPWPFPGHSHVASLYQYPSYIVSHYYENHRAGGTNSVHTFFHTPSVYSVAIELDEDFGSIFSDDNPNACSIM